MEKNLRVVKKLEKFCVLKKEGKRLLRCEKENFHIRIHLDDACCRSEILCFISFSSFEYFLVLGDGVALMAKHLHCMCECWIWIYPSREDSQDFCCIFIVNLFFSRIQMLSPLTPLDIILFSFIADFCNFLFFIFHYKLFFQFRDILLLKQRWDEWKGNFLDGCGWEKNECSYMKEISLLLFSISCWAFRFAGRKKKCEFSCG